MASTSATLIVLFVAVVCGGSGAVGAANSALDQVCEFVGASYVTPELCASALCYDPASPCRDARDYAAVASLAARLLARNATVTRDSVAVAARSANATAGLKSCLQLYDGLVPALEWAAGSVAAGRAYGAARELMQATQFVQRACAGMVGAEMPRENGGFATMATVAHAVLSTPVPKTD
ncbi:uncharacterized protein [Miscanthus floridulus]|uniref:uncharacterized protein n=1 Tax=Miscanthus floridulus TaxID=154761 RepID=UPI00345A983E